MEMRPYEGLQDLQAMLDLLSKGCRADNGTHYVHRGDLLVQPGQQLLEME